MSNGGCRGVGRDLSGFIDQALGARRCDEIAAHLLGCEACRREAESLRELRRILGAAPIAPAAPSGLASQLVSIAGSQSSEPLWVATGSPSLRLPSRRTRRRNQLVIAGTVLVVTVMALAMGGLMLAPQVDEVREPRALALRAFTASMPDSAVAQATSALLLAHDGHAALAHPTLLSRRPDYGTGLPLPASQARELLAAASVPKMSYRGVVQVATESDDGYLAGDAQVVEIPGDGVTTAVFDTDGDVVVAGMVPSASSTRAVLGSSDPVSRFAMVPGDWQVAGVHAVLLESYGSADVLSHRWWISPRLGLVLAIETYDDVGRVVQQGQFTELTLGDSGQTGDAPQLAFTAAGTPLGDRRELCKQWACPDQLGGLPLVSISTDSGSSPSMMQSVYSDGAVTLSVVQQYGRLAPGGLRANSYEQEGTPAVWSWQSGDMVVTVSSDAPDAVSRLACQQLPHLKAADDSVFARIRVGVGRMLGR